MELTPKTRKETFLAAAGGQDVTTPTPITREEVFLDAIAKNGGGGGGSTGGGVLVVHDVEGTLDKTWQEIRDALAQGIPCVAVYTDDIDVMQGQIVLVSASAGRYTVYALLAQGTTPAVAHWIATSADGYPVFGSV